MSWIRSQFASFGSKEASRLNNNFQPTSVQQDHELSISDGPVSNLKYFELFWHDASAVLCKSPSASEKPVRASSTIDDCEIVIHFTDKMVKLLTDESSTVGCDPQLLDYFYSEEVLDKLLAFCRQRPDYRTRLISHQLGIYDTLMSHSQQQLLIQTQFTRPLLSLLDDCKSYQIKDEDVEERLVSVLHQMCVAVTQNLNILDLLIESSIHDSHSKSFDLSMLLPFVHRIGSIGQQARDDLLLLMSLSSNHAQISRYITEKTDFCQVLVVSLSGLYSLLPRTFTYGSDDWYRITDDDVAGNSDLQMFLNLLEFCSAFVQVSHVAIQDQLLNFIFSGFLVSVIGPTLHQVQSGMDEAIAVTAYLDLFIRKIAEPRLLQVFLKFILLGKMEDVLVLEALIQRINSSNMRLCIVTLTLFRTLVDLNCEDVMYQLVFKYLLPCTHIMVSQQRSVTDIDVYGKAAEKLISMIPSACHLDNHRDGCCGDEKPLPTAYHHDDRSFSLIPEDSFPSSPASSSPLTSKRSRHWFPFRNRQQKAAAVDFAEVKGHAEDRGLVPVEDDLTASPTNNGSLDSSLTFSKCLHECGIEYLDYLQSARISIESCIVACRNWSYFYGGDGRSASCTLSPSSSAPTDPLSTDSDVVGGVRDVDVSETNSCDEISELNNSVVVVKNSDDLVPFLVRLNRVSVSEESEMSGDVVGEFERLLETLGDVVFLNGENISEAVELRTSSPSPRHSSEVERTGFAEDRIRPDVVPMNTGVTAQRPVFTDVQSRPTVISKSQSFPQCSDAVVRDARLSFVAHSMVGYGSGAGIGETPCIGPFLTAVLNKLESMKQNALYINLQLTGLVARLACYPQPLLSSLLLSPTLVFQPSVKSLMQVLNTVKCRIEEFLYEVKDRDNLLDHAYNFLHWRISLSDRRGSLDTGAKLMRRHSLMSVGPSPKPHPAGETKISSVISRLRILDNRHGAYFNNRQKKETPSGAQETLEVVETKNAIYCAVVFKEFLKELAAICQEHALLMLQETS